MILLEDPLDRTPVDNRLLELAKANRGAILTNDYNLQKVAETEHVDVLNLNNLALALRNEFVPGERAKVKIVAAGSGDHQDLYNLPSAEKRVQRIRGRRNIRNGSPLLGRKRDRGRKACQLPNGGQPHGRTHRGGKGAGTAGRHRQTP